MQASRYNKLVILGSQFSEIVGNKKHRSDRVTKSRENCILVLPSAHYAIINSDYDNIKSGTIISVYGLGSCIALVLYDKVNRVYAMSHILLPQNRRLANEGGIRYPHKYAEYSVKDLLNEVIKHGAEKKNIKAIVVGGSKIFQNHFQDIGGENTTRVLQELKSLKIKIARQDTGGPKGRTISLDTKKKMVTIKSIDGPDVRWNL